MNRYRLYHNNNPVFLKAWRTWRIIRPPEVVHCYKCHQWVERLDHHWLWISTCIGKYNYWPFLWFLIILNLTLLMWSIHAFLLIFTQNQINESVEVHERLYLYPQAFIMIILVFPAMIFTMPLMGFHFYLVCKNMTTLQYIDRKNEKHLSSSIKVNSYNIKKNKLKATIVPVLFNRTPSVIKRIATEQAEKVSFSNRVDEDLVVEYQGLDAPPTDRFNFDTATYSREETKQSLRRRSEFGYKKTSREMHNTDTSIYDIHQTRGNHSYVSDQSAYYHDVSYIVWLYLHFL